MPTAEIYRINEDGTRTYAGYALYDAQGNYLGSRGGYGSRKNGRGGNVGRGNRAEVVNQQGRAYNGGLRYQGNNARNGASMLQNTILTSGGRGGARRRGR